MQQKLDEAENRCRILFDQLTTAEQNVEQLRTELERSRGDFRTLQKIVTEWPAEEGEEPTPPSALPVLGSFPAGEPANPPSPATVPPAVDANVKEKGKKS